MYTLICGSLAYDTIMVFQDQFKNHILPDKIHILNVAFLVPEMRREFGGTAGNIAYNLNLLGGSPRIMATVGEDFASYTNWLREVGISDKHIRRVPDTFTAQAFITTDRDDNQITAFHPGAMNFSHQNKVSDSKQVTLGIIAPDGRDGMFQHADEFKKLGIPFMFDPGQGLPMFDSAELHHFIELADYMALNDYEAQLLQDKTGLSLDSLANQVRALIVTMGAQGSHIYTHGKRLEIPCVKAEQVIDPTGCGDAYRSGLLYGIAHDWDWKAAGQLASVMGSIKIASRGGQNHRPSKQEIAERYQKAFGESITL
jgi:adenosine kinase